MATTTPNYGWDVPTSTDYVKDGAVAIETLGDDIDASLFSITGGKNVGAQFISATTFTGVSNFTASNIFTSAYNNYLLTFELTAGTSNVEVRAQLTTGGTPSTASYAYARTASDSAAASRFEGSNSIAQLPVTFCPATANVASMLMIRNPAQAIFTSYTSQWVYDDGGTYMGGMVDGRHRVATAYDGIKFFNITSMTGVLKVYGLRNS